MWLLCGCEVVDFKSDPGTKQKLGTAGGLRVVKEDRVMMAAVDQAKVTAGDFVNAVLNPSPKQTLCSFKVPFTQGEIVEQLWVADVLYDGRNLRGVVDNHPSRVKTVRKGDPVTIPPAGITDWLVVDDGKLYGGFTLRVLRARMTPKDRALFDKKLPVKLASADKK